MGRHALLLGKQVALGDSAFRAGLQDAAAGHFQREVLLRRLGNQLIEGRVAKRRPPAGVVTFAATQAGVAGFDPGFRDRGVRRAVVWANFETVVPPLSSARAAGQRKNQDQESCASGTKPRVGTVVQRCFMILSPFQITLCVNSLKSGKPTRHRSHPLRRLIAARIGRTHLVHSVVIVWSNNTAAYSVRFSKTHTIHRSPLPSRIRQINRQCPHAGPRADVIDGGFADAEDPWLPTDR